jgi:hypothetical protein
VFTIYDKREKPSPLRSCLRPCSSASPQTEELRSVAEGGGFYELNAAAELLGLVLLQPWSDPWCVVCCSHVLISSIIEIKFNIQNIQMEPSYIVCRKLLHSLVITQSSETIATDMSAEVVSRLTVMKISL